MARRAAPPACDGGARKIFSPVLPLLPSCFSTVRTTHIAVGWRERQRFIELTASRYLIFCSCACSNDRA